MGTSTNALGSDLRLYNAESIIDLMQAEKNSRGALIVVGRPISSEGNNGDMVLRKVDNEIRVYGKLDNHWYIMVAKDMSNIITGSDEAIEVMRGSGDGASRRPIRGLNSLATSIIPLYDSDWFPFKINTSYDFKWNLGKQGPNDIKVYYTRTQFPNISATEPTRRISPTGSRPPGDFVIMVNPYYSEYEESGTKKQGVNCRYDVKTKNLNIQIARDRLLVFFNKTTDAFVEAKPSSSRGASGFQDYLRIKVWK